MIGRHAVQAAGWSRFTARIAHLIAWIRTEHRVRRDLAELRAADDRLLADIGLSRSEIDDVVRHGRRCDDMDRNVRP
jgi:uncharacterized protein YjiS (DUF1127 family)